MAKLNLSKYSKERQIRIVAGYLKRRKHHGTLPRDVTLDDLKNRFKFSHLQNNPDLIKRALAYLRKAALVELEYPLNET
jgi:hypothetical protein